MNAVELIKADEELRLQLYKCTADKWSIGYGRNIEDRGISLDEAELMFRNDFTDSVKELRSRIEYYDTLSEVRKAVLISMHFNLGWPKLSKFVKFFAALESQKYALASNEMLNSKWARQVKNRASRLAEMMRYDEWVS